MALLTAHVIAQETVEQRQHQGVTVVLGAHFDVRQSAQEKDGRQQHRSQRQPCVAHEQPGTFITLVENEGIEHARQPVHACVVMRTDQVTDAVDEPQQWPLAVGKIDVRRHPVHPRLAAQIEPDHVMVLPQVIKIRIPRHQQQRHHSKGTNTHQRPPINPTFSINHHHGCEITKKT